MNNLQLIWFIFVLAAVASGSEDGGANVQVWTSSTEESQRGAVVFKHRWEEVPAGEDDFIFISLVHRGDGNDEAVWSASGRSHAEAYVQSLLFTPQEWQLCTSSGAAGWGMSASLQSAVGMECTRECMDGLGRGASVLGVGPDRAQSFRCSTSPPHLLQDGWVDAARSNVQSCAGTTARAPFILNVECRMGSCGVEVLFRVENVTHVAECLGISEPSVESTSVGNGSPPALVTTRIHRTLDSSGQHRELTSSISLSGVDAVNIQGCQLVLVEYVPPELYIDMYQVDENFRFGQGPAIESFAPIELERPSYKSLSYIAVARVPLEQGRDEYKITIPIHLRYQSPSSTDMYSPVSIPRPRTFIECGDSDIALTRKKIYARLDWASALTSPMHVLDLSPGTVPIVTKMPVGQLGHHRFVYLATFAATSLGSLFIIWAMWKQ